MRFAIFRVLLLSVSVCGTLTSVFLAITVS